MLTTYRLRFAAWRAEQRKRQLGYTLGRLRTAYVLGYIDRDDYERRCDEAREAFR